ncbi:MAG: class I SAM-dependent methyltransferase [Actinomycetota bacterium]|nr:class I SAM-dependent methyltransferase [Actinomycetota bacterium]
MSFDETMGTVMRLSAGAEALAALGAKLQADVDGIELDAAVAEALDDVVAELAIDLAALSSQERAIVATAARAFLLLAGDMLADAERSPGWAIEDPGVLLSIGRMSAFIAEVIAAVVPTLDGLHEALDREGASICDVGSGVGALSIAFCRTWPNARVVGLDPWPPALALAEEEVARSGVADCIELRQIGVEELMDEELFDAVWFAGPFVPPEVVPAGLRRVHAALRPGGWLIFGLFAGPSDPVARAVTKLRVVRSGGSVAGADELQRLLTEVGFVDVHEVERTWQAPAALLAGRRAPGGD